MDADFESRVAHGIWVVDFWAEWCGPCREAAPAFHSLAQELAGVNFARLNVDENPSIAHDRRWKKTSGIPYFAIIQDGKFIDHVVGFNNDKAFKRRLKNKINPLLGPTA
jgi:thioredoxin 1